MATDDRSDSCFHPPGSHSDSPWPAGLTAEAVVARFSKGGLDFDEEGVLVAYTAKRLKRLKRPVFLFSVEGGRAPPRGRAGVHCP